MKKKARVIWSILMVCMLVASLAVGCGSTPKTAGDSGTEAAQSTAAATEGEKTAAPETKEKVSLKLYSFAPDRAEAYQKINEAFQKTHPNIELVFEGKDAGQYYSLLATAIQAGDAPDLFTTHAMTSSNFFQLVAQGTCLQLDDLIDVSGFTPWAVDWFRADGKLYQSPAILGDMVGTYYNQTLFEKFGLSEPKNEEELVNICETMLKNNITPFLLPGKDSYECLWAFLVFVASEIPEWNNGFPATKKYSDPEFLEATKKFASWIDKGYFGKDYRSLDLNSGMMLFSQGKVAMANQGSWEANLYKEIKDQKISMFFCKQPDGKDAGIASPAQVCGYCIYSGTKHKDEAVEMVKFLMTPEANQFIADMGSTVPLSMPAAEGLTSPVEIIQKFAGADNLVPTFCDTTGLVAAEGYDTFETLASTIQKLVFKKITPEDVVTEFEKMTDYSKLAK